ncbi:hypothetical protein [Caulobacter sp. 17J80-11]|uniref:hypothetical protein n=1 Tax=Caulobacter sp. 17J80-11 TaxID=2763502 RepID=UPI0016534680|nr:hypothetical protein [Caulobacter sp. 17J80-11]MBC6982327.1 hypothetical protein [Caulobacter sp. 17J80-11]
MQGESTETEAAWAPPPETLAAQLQAEGVPAWLPKMVAELRNRLNPSDEARLAYGLTQRAQAWSAFDAAAWDRLESGLRAFTESNPKAVAERLIDRLLAGIDVESGARRRLWDRDTDAQISHTITLLGRLGGNLSLAQPRWAGRWARDWSDAHFHRAKREWRDADPAGVERALALTRAAAVGIAAAAVAALPRPRSPLRGVAHGFAGLRDLVEGKQTLEDLRRWRAVVLAGRAGVRQAAARAREDARSVRTQENALLAVDAAGWAAWATELSRSGGHMIHATLGADLAREQARAEAAVRLIDVLVRAMDAAAGLSPAPPAPSPPTLEEIEVAEEERETREHRPYARECANPGPDPTREQRVVLAERLVANGAVVAATRRPAFPLKTEEWWCPLAVFGWDIYDENLCPDDLMPGWLADLAMKLGEGLGEDGQAELCAGLVARARAWPALDAAAWERIELDLLDAAVAHAEAAAANAPRAEPRWRMYLDALRQMRSRDEITRWEGRDALGVIPGRGPAATEARLLARADARVAALNAADRRDPDKARSHNCAWAVKMAAEAAGQAAWAARMGKGAVMRASQARWSYDKARRETCRAFMARLFERMDAELAAAN